jgi:hypothetical protein
MFDIFRLILAGALLPNKVIVLSLVIPILLHSINNGRCSGILDTVLLYTTFKKYIYRLYILGHAIAEAARHWLLTTETQVQSQVTSSVICGGQSW